MPFLLIKEALTACNAANLSFVMLLFNDVFQFMLRQSLDAQEITFSIRAICTETFFFYRELEKTFQFENSTKLHAFHFKPYDILTLRVIH